ACPCLALGLNRRFDLLMESSMRPTCDKPVALAHGSVGVAEVLPSIAGVIYVIFSVCGGHRRTVTDAHGRLRSLPGLRSFAVGFFPSLTVATLCCRSRKNVAEGAGLNAQGTGKIKNALPAWMRTRRIICGSVPRHFAPIAWVSGRPTTCF